MKIKKILSKIIIAFLVMAMFVGAFAVGLSSTKAEGNILFAAHRGLSAYYPENTLPAVEEAAKAGFYAFECDVQTTKDGQWVVMHNTTIDHMTNGEGEISAYTYQELLEFNIDAGNGIENYPELKIPTIEELLSVCDSTDIIPIIEIKGGEIEQLTSLYEIIKSHKLEEKCIIISFNFEYLTALKEIDKNINCMYLVNKVTKEDVDLCIEHGNIGIDFSAEDVLNFDSALSYAREQGLKLAAWTVDWNFLANYLYSRGAKIITTNKLNH